MKRAAVISQAPVLILFGVFLFCVRRFQGLGEARGNDYWLFRDVLMKSEGSSKSVDLSIQTPAVHNAFSSAQTHEADSTEQYCRATTPTTRLWKT